MEIARSSGPYFQVPSIMPFENLNPGGGGGYGASEGRGKVIIREGVGLEQFKANGWSIPVST